MMKNSRTAKRLFAAFIASMFIIGGLGIAFVPTAKAFTNNLDSTNYNQTSGTSSVPIGASVRANNPGDPTVGDLVVVSTICRGSTTSISTVSTTDSATWTNGFSFTYGAGGTQPYTLSAWYSTVTVGAGWTETITLSASSAWCFARMQAFNVGTLGFPSHAVWGQLATQGTTIAGTFTNPAPALDVMFAGGNLTTAGGGSGYSSCSNGTPTITYSSPFTCSAPATSGGAGGVDPYLDEAWFYTAPGGPTSYGVVYNTASGQVLEAGIILAFGISGTPPPTNGSQVLGDCPTKDTSTHVLANNTVYMWQSTLLGNSVFGTFKWALQSVTSAAASENVYIAVYLTGAAGAPSPSNPLFDFGSKTYLINPGVYNAYQTWTPPNPGFLLNFPAGTTIAIAIMGNDKVKINQTTLSGMVSYPAPGGVLPVQVTSSGTSSAFSLAFCANINFQTSLTTTVTVTTTGSATSTFITTATVTTLDQNAALSGSVNFSVLLILLLGPAVLLAGVMGVVVKSGIAAMMGAFIGLLIGAGVGNLSGLIPLWMVGVTVLAAILLLVAMVSFSRGSG